MHPVEEAALQISGRSTEAYWEALLLANKPVVLDQFQVWFLVLFRFRDVPTVQEANNLNDEV